ncbi:hypothetical protein [uncultured Clostridium sp.]|uniref:hypothetical protein n=1 Tax=uncultured Clostridium sp. TaxID=59620 RepID=UPI0032172BDC
MCKERIRKVFLDDLPKINKGIDWKECARLHSKIKFIYEDIEDELEIIKHNGENLILRYNNKDFEMKRNNFVKCKLGKILSKKTPDFKIKIGTHFKDEKRDIVITDRKYIREENIDKLGRKSVANRKYYKYKCNKCNFDCNKNYYNCKSGEYNKEYWITEGSLLNQDAGCSVCSNQIVVPHINSIVAKEETHWMMPYFQGGYDEAKKYTPNSTRLVKCICPDCGRIKNKKIAPNQLYHNHSIGCVCGDGFSINEKYVFNLLEQLGITFKTQLSKADFTWCDKYKYDFYFIYNNKEYIIETDGGWHYKDNTMSGQTKEETKAIDNYKDKLAEEHGIKVIRIDCEFSDLKFIENNILNSELNDIFHLSKINWVNCEKFAMTNIKKMICKYWGDKEEWESVSDLSKKFNICNSAIINYLNQGTKLGWCNYNGKEEQIKSNKINGYLSVKSVEVFEDGNSLGIFKSVKALSEQSLELFGVQLNRENISAVARGKRPHHHGFTFRYVTETTTQEPNPKQSA